MDLTFLISAYVTLFVIIDPVGLAPLYIALTDGMSPQRRRLTGLRALAVAAILLTLFALAGDGILSFIGISLPAFRIAGGVLLFLTALDMLFERRTRRREGQAQEEVPHDPGDDPSVFPLATPLLAGPGALASMILLSGQGEGVVHMALVIAVMLAVLATTWVMFVVSVPLARALGATGTMVVTRLLGMLLAALSIQFVIDGLNGTGLF